MDIHRTVTQGENITDVVVTEGNEFDLVMEVYDDQGAAFEDGLGCGIIVRMSEGSYARWTATVTAVADGEVTINFPSEATDEPGEYICELKLYDSAATPDTYLTIGYFNFIVQEIT